MALRQYRPDLDEKYIQKEKQAKYQNYTPISQKKERLREFVFFLNLSIFSVLTVLATYIYLSLKIPSFFAFILAIATGFIGLHIIRVGFVRYKRHLKQKRN